MLFAIDATTELNLPGLGHACRLSALLSSLKTFIFHKLRSDNENEIGLCLLTPTQTTMLCDFTSDIELLSSSFELIQCTDSAGSYDLSLLLGLVLRLQEEKSLFKSEGSLEVDKVFRLVLVYGRCKEVPSFLGGGMEAFVDNASVFIDIVYIHEGGDKSNQVVQWLTEKFDGRHKQKAMYVVQGSTNFHKFMQEFLMLLA